MKEFKENQQFLLKEALRNLRAAEKYGTIDVNLVISDKIGDMIGELERLLQEKTNVNINTID